jgi:hypothetical protein
VPLEDVAGSALHALPSPKHLLLALGEYSEYGGDVGSDRGSKVPNPLILKVWLPFVDSYRTFCLAPDPQSKHLLLTVGSLTSQLGGFHAAQLSANPRTAACAQDLRHGGVQQVWAIARLHAFHS